MGGSLSPLIDTSKLAATLEAHRKLIRSLQQKLRGQGATPMLLTALDGVVEALDVAMDEARLLDK